MATIPTYTRQASIDTAPGTIPNTRLSGAVGEALAGAGAELSAIGAHLAKREAQRQEFLAQQGFMQLETGYQSDLAEIERKMDPTGKGFHDTAMTVFDDRAKAFLGSLPPQLRDQYAVRVDTLKMARSTDAAKVEAGQWDVYQTEETGKMLDTLATGITQYGAGSMDDYIAQGEEIINATSLPEIKKRELVEAWRETAQTTALLSMPPEERKRALGDAFDIDVPAAAGSVVDKIIGAESGGNATAKNPNSSATGAGQFIDSTWINMIRKYRPDIADGKSRSQLLALRNDYGLSREMTQRYAEENASALQAAGFQPTAGNIYLAHFLGPQGAIDMLRADPNADAASVNPGAANSNKSVFYRHGNPKSVAQVIAWAEGKMGGSRSVSDIQRPATPPDPRFASVPLDMRLKLISQADNEIEAAQRDMLAALTAERAKIKDEFSLRIATGDPSLTPQDILGSNLDNGDKAALITSYNTKHKDRVDAVNAMAAFEAGALRVDPYSSDGRKTVDNMFGEIAKTIPPEQIQATTEEIVRQTGIVPGAALNAIRAGISSQNEQEVMLALQSAQRISATDPAALGRRDGGGEVQRAADDFSHYVNNLNMTPEQAARKIMDARDPQKQRERKALEPAAKEFLKDIEDTDIGALFDESIFGIAGNPSVGFTPAQEYGIKAEYMAIAEEEFYRANGDPDIAKNRAAEQMKRLYGVTEITGRSVVMKHPPERYWPEFSVADEIESRRVAEDREKRFGIPFQGERLPEGPITYREQIEADITALDATADLSSIQLVTTPETDAMIKRGEMPGYAVMYKDANGVLQTIPGKLWRPDTTILQQMQGERDAVTNAERMKDARRIQRIERQQIQRRQHLENEQRATGARLRGAPMSTGTPQPVAPPSSTPSAPMSTPQVGTTVTPAQIRQRAAEMRQRAIDSGVLPQGGR